ETLRRVMGGRTTVLIAHRRSTLQLADRIAVLDDGRLVDEGSHDELLARCALYRLLLAGPGEDAEGIDAGELAHYAGPRGDGAEPTPASRGRLWPEGSAARPARADPAPGGSGPTGVPAVGPPPPRPPRPGPPGTPPRPRLPAPRGWTQAEPGPPIRISRCGGCCGRSRSRSWSAWRSTPSTHWPTSPCPHWCGAGSTTASRPRPCAPSSRCRRRPCWSSWRAGG